MQQLEDKLEDILAQSKKEQIVEIIKLINQQGGSLTSLDVSTKDVSIPKTPLSHGSLVECAVKTCSQSEILKDEDDRELSIPVEHTTVAHKLLLWPSIRQLFTKEIDEDYVMTLEQDRGLIRVYGHSKGDDQSNASSLSNTNSSNPCLKEVSPNVL